MVKTIILIVAMLPQVYAFVKIQHIVGSFWVLLLSSVKQQRETFYLGLFFPITEAKLFQIFYRILHET